MWSNDCLKQFLKRNIRSLLDQRVVSGHLFQNISLNLLAHVRKERVVPFAHLLYLVFGKIAVFSQQIVISCLRDISVALVLQHTDHIWCHDGECP